MFLLRLQKIIHSLTVPVYWRTLLHGTLPTIEHTLPIVSLDPDLVLDVGANKGQFAILARHLFPEALLYCFEPLEQPFRRLCRVVPEAHCHQVALGQGPARTERINVSGRVDSSSLLSIAQLQDEVFPGTHSIGQEDINVVPPSDLLSIDLLRDHRVLLKIDVQGYEQEVLTGMGELLAEVDFIFVELSYVELYEGQPLAADIVGQLKQAGFELAGVYNQHNTSHGVAIQADFLFTREPRFPQKPDS